MKFSSIALFGISLLVLCGCTGSGTTSSSTASSGALPVAANSSSNVAASRHEPKLEGNTLTYGNHRYTVDGEIKPDEPVTGRRDTPTATVTFTNVPADYEEFEAVYTNLLGKSVHGTAAMVPMAIEMFARDQSTGERCLELLCNSQATVSGITRILKTKLTPAKHAPANDSYLQRYMAAALLKGAKADNAYTPDKPYTVQMCASANKPQQSAGGTVTFIYILAKGWDTEQRAVDVLKPNGEQLHKVFNCPATYTQCKNIVGSWPGLD